MCFYGIYSGSLLLGSSDSRGEEGDYVDTGKP